MTSALNGDQFPDIEALNRAHPTDAYREQVAGGSSTAPPLPSQMSCALLRR